MPAFCCSQPHWACFFSLPFIDVVSFDSRSLRQLRGRVGALWPEALALLADFESPPQLQRACYCDAVLQRPAQGSLDVHGCAAHVISVQIGQGLTMALLDAAALADCLAGNATVECALAEYGQPRKSHSVVYQQLSRWMTPMFQSDRDGLARLRDAAFGPFGRLPPTRGTMLKVLTGTKMRWSR